MSNTMQVTMAGDLIGATTAQEVAGQIVGAQDVLIPGVWAWDNVGHTETKGDSGSAVTIIATITTDEVISGGDYDGAQVTTEFVRTYILGAGEYFVSVAGDMFSPTTVSVVQTSPVVLP